MHKTIQSCSERVGERGGTGRGWTICTAKEFLSIWFEAYRELPCPTPTDWMEWEESEDLYLRLGLNRRKERIGENGRSRQRKWL